MYPIDIIMPLGWWQWTAVAAGLDRELPNLYFSTRKLNHLGTYSPRSYVYFPLHTSKTILY